MNYFEDETFIKDEFKEFDKCENSEFIGCEFESIDFSNTSFKNSKLIECQFKNCNLSNIICSGLSFRDVSFSNSKMVGVNFSVCTSWFELSFIDSVLDYSVFQDIDGTNSSFKKCSLKEVDFSSSNLKNSNFEEANLIGANFTNSDMSGANFIGAINYFIDPQFVKIKKAKFSLPEALSLLKSFEIEIH